jgi:hypothetical protein
MLIAAELIGLGKRRGLGAIATAAEDGKALRQRVSVGPGGQDASADRATAEQHHGERCQPVR